MTALAYYVSGHGFGHAVRSAQVIRTLQALRPDLQIHVRTPAPAWLFSPVVSLEAVSLDVGVVQPDALQIDEAATLARAAALFVEIEPLVECEADFLKRAAISLVVADIPPPAFLAARRARLPSVAIANFSWDWIYAPYVAGRSKYAWLVDWLREAYGQADLLLRLPFHGDLSAFPAREDVPLVVRPPSASREVAREQLGLRDEDAVVLLGFGGLGLHGLRVDRLDELRRYTFLATEKEIDTQIPLPPNVRLLPVRQPNYNDLIAAADVVVGKPGFGMVGTCLAQRRPLLYTDRGAFPEYEVLVDAIHQFGRGVFIPQAELLDGNLGPYLAEVLAIDREWPPLRIDGDAVIARRLLALLDGG